MILKLAVRVYIYCLVPLFLITLLHLRCLGVSLLKIEGMLLKSLKTTVMLRQVVDALFIFCELVFDQKWRWALLLLCILVLLLWHLILVFAILLVGEGYTSWVATAGIGHSVLFFFVN